MWPFVYEKGLERPRGGAHLGDRCKFRAREDGVGGQDGAWRTDTKAITQKGSTVLD